MVIEATSEAAFPAAFNLRNFRRSIQYITAKTAIWRARLSARATSFISNSHLPRESLQKLNLVRRFRSDLSTSTKMVGRCLDGISPTSCRIPKGRTRNPVAYHLYNACEATASSVDARAVGVSVAVEAVASLISIEDDKRMLDRLTLFQERTRKCLEAQSDLADIAVGSGQISSISGKRPTDILYALAKTGHVEEAYIKPWKDLRNRHVHPTLKDLKKPDLADYQKLLDDIRRVETLLRQLTFYLIGYEGPFTDYGDIPSSRRSSIRFRRHDGPASLCL